MSGISPEPYCKQFRAFQNLVGEHQKWPRSLIESRLKYQTNCSSRMGHMHGVCPCPICPYRKQVKEPCDHRFCDIWACSCAACATFQPFILRSFFLSVGTSWGWIHQLTHPRSWPMQVRTKLVTRPLKVIPPSVYNCSLIRNSSKPAARWHRILGFHQQCREAASSKAQVHFQKV